MGEGGGGNDDDMKIHSIDDDWDIEESNKKKLYK